MMYEANSLRAGEMKWGERERGRRREESRYFALRSTHLRKACVFQLQYLKTTYQHWNDRHNPFSNKD